MEQSKLVERLEGYRRRNSVNQSYVNSDLYRLFYSRDLYIIAYNSVKSNDGAETSGADGTSLHGFCEEWITELISSMRDESYQPQPNRTTMIPKKNGKMRKLSFPTWSDKLLQEVIRLMLNIYFDPQFSNASHGFRSNRGCHTALDSIRAKGGWKSVKWFVEGDIRDCFGSIDHGILIGILTEKVKDNRFLRLMKQFLECGYMEAWKYNATLSGCPQGSILSPLLSNLYMDKFDQFMKKDILPVYNCGGRRAENKTYKLLSNQVKKHMRHQDWKIVRELNKQRQSMPSKDTNDPAFRRLYYIRYADDCAPRRRVHATRTVA